MAAKGTAGLVTLSCAVFLTVLFSVGFSAKLSANSVDPQIDSPLSLSDAERRYLSDKGIIRVCVDPNRLPFDGIDENGRHGGLSSDYFKEFSQRLGVEMVVHPVQNWNDLMRAARNRECDAVSQINASEERKVFLDFTSPYLVLPLAVVTKSNRIFIDESLEIEGNRFAVIAGDIAIDKLRARYPRVNLVEVVNNVDGLKKVSNGEVFGYIGAQGAVAFALSTHDLDKTMGVTGSIPLSYDLAVATRNDEPLLGQAIEKAIQSIDPRTAQRLRDKWIAITITKVTDYTLLWVVLAAATALLGVSFFWNRRLSHANRQIKDALSKLHIAQIQLEQQNQTLQEQSATDPLTRLHNRKKLDDILTDEFQRAERSATPFGIIIADIDHFKQINDTHGHQIGDEVLVTLSHAMKVSLRAIDSLGRWGGEEFLIICPETDLSGCRTVAENLRKAVAECETTSAGQRTASFGVAIHQLEDSIDDLIGRADAALYRAKNAGRNRVETEPSPS